MKHQISRKSLEKCKVKSRNTVFVARGVESRNQAPENSPSELTFRLQQHLSRLGTSVLRRKLQQSSFLPTGDFIALVQRRTARPSFARKTERFQFSTNTLT